MLREEPVRRETIEIYSDAANAAVIRHPARRFPGVLIQGDTLASLVKQVERIQRVERGAEEAAAALADLHERLSELLIHYKNVLVSHSMELPFPE